MGQSKLKNRVSWKMFEVEFKFSKLVKSIVFSVSEPKKRLAAQRNGQGKHAFVKENEKKNLC